MSIATECRSHVTHLTDVLAEYAGWNSVEWNVHKKRCEDAVLEWYGEPVDEPVREEYREALAELFRARVHMDAIDTYRQRRGAVA